MTDPFDDFVAGMDMDDLQPHSIFEKWGAKVYVLPVELQPRINWRVVIGMVIGALVGMAVRKLIENVVREWKVE